MPLHDELQKDVFHLDFDTSQFFVVCRLLHNELVQYVNGKIKGQKNLLLNKRRKKVGISCKEIYLTRDGTGSVLELFFKDKFNFLELIKKNNFQALLLFKKNFRQRSANIVIEY